MQKFFCDICKNEFKPKELVGKFTYLDKNYLVKQPDRTVTEITADLCAACVQAVKKLLDERIKALEGNND